MKKDIGTLKKEIEELTNLWKRALADYQNLQKRQEREKADFVQYANANLILKLLAALDHLEKVQTYLKDDGLDLAIKELKKVLAEEGLAEIEALGKGFNPQEMEAVGVAEGGKDGQAAEVVCKGYRLKGRVVRPAKVKVAKAVKIESGEKKTDSQSEENENK